MCTLLFPRMLSRGTSHYSSDSCSMIGARSAACRTPVDTTAERVEAHGGAAAVAALNSSPDKLIFEDVNDTLNLTQDDDGITEGG